MYTHSNVNILYITLINVYNGVEQNNEFWDVDLTPVWKSYSSYNPEILAWNFGKRGYKFMLVNYRWGMLSIFITNLLFCFKPINLE